MVNVYWVNNFSMTKLGGEDIGEYGDGYYARLFSTKYSNSDFVVPSKLNVKGNIKLLRSLVGFANQLGNSALTFFYECWLLYILDSVIHFSGNAIKFLCPTNSSKVVFNSNDACSILFMLGNNIEDANSGLTIRSKILAGKLNLTFPFNSYIKGISESATESGNYTQFSKLTEKMS